MATFSTLDAAWGTAPSTNMFNQATPQNAYEGGNVPQKVYNGGNVPQKVFEHPVDDTPPPNEEHERLMKALIMEQQRHAMRIEQLMHLLSSKPVEPTKGMTVMDIILIVLALVFIVLVIFLISCVRGLRAHL